MRLTFSVTICDRISVVMSTSPQSILGSIGEELDSPPQRDLGLKEVETIFFQILEMEHRDRKNGV